MYYQHFGLHGSPFNFTPHMIGYFFSARIADSRWVRNAVLTAPSRTRAWSRTAGFSVKRDAAPRGLWALTLGLLGFEFLDPLFDRVLIEAPVRAHLKGGYSTI